MALQYFGGPKDGQSVAVAPPPGRVELVWGQGYYYASADRTRVLWRQGPLSVAVTWYED